MKLLPLVLAGLSFAACDTQANDPQTGPRAVDQPASSGQHESRVDDQTREGPLTGDALEQAFEAAAPGAVRISEADDVPTFITATPSFRMTEAMVRRTFTAEVTAFLTSRESLPETLAFEMLSKKRSEQFLRGLDQFEEGDDEFFVESAQAFARIHAVLDGNLKQVRVVFAGLDDGEGNVAEDPGKFIVLVVGVTADGQLAGYIVGKVHT